MFVIFYKNTVTTYLTVYTQDFLNLKCSGNYNDCEQQHINYSVYHNGNDWHKYSSLKIHPSSSSTFTNVRIYK
jgi:hypothetical protein